MAFFSDWANKIGSALQGLFPGLTGVLLSKADGSADLWQSDGSGAAKVSSGQMPASLGAKAKSASLSVCLATDSLLAPPSTPSAITPSDATDLTTIAPIGITIGTGGTLAFRCAGAPATTITTTVQSGQFIYGQFTRVMAATTATGIVGWAP